MSKTFLRASSLFAVILIVACSMPSPARAFPVEEIGLNLVENTLSAVKAVTGCDAKECGLDAIAWTISKMAIQTMTKSVVGWINNGFNGSPAFVTNIDVYLGQISDATANQFFGQLSSNAAIRSPFQTTVSALTQTNYLKSTNANGFFLSNPYTLNQFTHDDAGFIAGKTFDGGWQAWLAMTTQPQNNPLGAQQLAQDELQKRIATAQTNSIKQLDWGQGFLSWCGDKDDSAPDPNAGTQGTIQTVTVTAQQCLGSDGKPGEIKTPGSVIQAQLNKTLGLTGDQLVTADEFNEIIGALMSQLVGQVLGSTGLSGVSQPSSNGSIAINQATNAAQLTGNSGAIANAFTQGVTNSQEQVKQYQTAWATIGTAAAEAIAAGGNSCPNTNASPADVKSQADAAATASSAALTELQKISTEAVAAGQSGTVSDSQAGTGGASSTSLQDVATEYQNFVNSTASPRMPSATDIQYAATQSQDSGTSTPATLYTQMKLIANACLSL